MPGPSGRRKWTAVATGLVVAAALGLVLRPADGPGSVGPLPRLADPASSGRLADMVGVVNLWASWCVACRLEHPLLESLAARGVAVYGVNHRDRRDDALRWLGFYGDPYRYSLFDADGRLGRALGIDALPVTLVVGPGGEVRYVRPGPLNQGIIDAEILPRLAAGPAQGTRDGT